MPLPDWSNAPSSKKCKMKLCKRKTPFTCRDCGGYCCGHHRKNDNMDTYKATCVSCAVKQKHYGKLRKIEWHQN